MILRAPIQLILPAWSTLKPTHQGQQIAGVVKITPGSPFNIDIKKYFIISFLMVSLSLVVFNFGTLRCSQSALLIDDKEVQMNSVLRMGLGLNGSARDFDPQKVLSIVDAHQSRNLYSRLVSLDDDGKIHGELASDFYWNGDSFVINLKPDLFTVDGYKISEEDVKISYIRLMRSGQTTHGNLREWLCPDYDPNRPFECSGLVVEPGKIILTPRHKEHRQFFLPILAASDFSIIPKGSLDFSKAHWPIKDFRNTTGVYYIDNFVSDDEVIWKLNKRHPLASDDMFQEISVIATTPGPDSIKAFRMREVDFLSTSAGVKQSDIAGSESNTVVHASYPIKLVQMSFTRRGKERMDANQRLALGYLIKQNLHHRLNPEDGQAFDQIFPVDSEGALSLSQLDSYKRSLQSARWLDSQGPIRVAVGSSFYQSLEPVLKRIKGIEITVLKNLRELEDISKKYDAFIVSGDTSFYESLSMVHYYFSVGAFGDYSEGLSWMKDYMSILSKVDRLPKLRELHAQLLNDGLVIPLYASSYIAIGRQPMRMKISKFFAGTPMWMVFRQ